MHSTLAGFCHLAGYPRRIPRGILSQSGSTYHKSMKCLVLAAAAALTLGIAPIHAQPAAPLQLDGSMQGTTTAPARGEVQVITNSEHQFIRFDKDFSVASQAETEVRLVDGQTGKVSFIAFLSKKNGYQIYEVPEHLHIDDGDKIVIYSPLRAENVATVELLEDE